MKNYMQSFVLMLGFFTRLPVPRVEFTEERYRRAMKMMPLVGLVIGALLVLIHLVLVLAHAPSLICGALMTGAYLFLTGGLHFDGLADTCDGVFSGRSREQSLEIMKDSHIGVFGTLGVFMAGLLYFVAFSAVPAAGFLVFPVCGRACCLISASLAPYAREDGMGKATGLEGGSASILAAVFTIIGATALKLPLLAALAFLGIRWEIFSPLLFGLSGWGVFLMFTAISLFASGAAILVTIGITRYFRQKLGGVTGDTFGAVIEASSITYLIVYILLFRILLL